MTLNSHRSGDTYLRYMSPSETSPSARSAAWLLAGSAILVLLASLLRPSPAHRPALRSEALRRDALALDRPLPGRPHPRRRRRPVAAQRLLHRRLQRRRVEDDRLRPRLAPGLRRPAHGLDRRDRRRALEPRHRLRRHAAKACSAPTSRSATASTNPPTPAAPGPTSACATASRSRRSPSTRATPTASSPPSSATPTAPTRSAASIRSLDGGKSFAARPLRRREHRRLRGRRSIPRIRPSSTPASGNRARAPGRTPPGAAPSGGLFKSTDGGATWHELKLFTPGPPARRRHRPGRRAQIVQVNLGIAPSDPRRIYAAVALVRGTALYRSDDAGATWTPPPRQPPGRAHRRRRPAPPRASTRPNPDIVFVASTVSWKSTDGGQTFRAFKRRARRRRLPEHLDQPDQPRHPPLRERPGRHHHRERRRDLELLVQPADRPALPRRGRQRLPLPRLQRPAGERLGRRPEPRQRRPHHLPRLAARRRRRVRLRRARPARPRHRLRRPGRHPLGPAHRPGPERSAPASPGAAPTGGPSGPSPSSSRPSIRARSFFAANTLWKTRDGGQSWTRISPDLTRKTWEVPAAVGKYRDDPSAKPSRRGVIYTVAPSYVDANVIWAGTDDGLIHVTTDGGLNWTDVTPPQLGPWAKVSLIDAGRFDRQDRLRRGQHPPPRRPAAAHLPHPRRRQDLDRDRRRHPGRGADQRRPRGPGAPRPALRGTEREVFVSFDDGDRWQSLRLNMAAELDARHHRQGRRPRRGHPRPRLLDPGQHHAPPPARRGRGGGRRPSSSSPSSRPGSGAA